MGPETIFIYAHVLLYILSIYLFIIHTRANLEPGMPSAAYELAHKNLFREILTRD